MSTTIASGITISEMPFRRHRVDSTGSAKGSMRQLARIRNTYFFNPCVEGGRFLQHFIESFTDHTGTE
jgi:hypothetical protein